VRLKRTRIARTMNVMLNLSGYRYRPGMYVKVNFPSIGIVNVEMRVTDRKFGVQNGVQLTLKQETADVWGDAIGKPIERPPFTQLPSGGVAQPQNLKYTVEEIGQVVQGILSWQNIGQVVYNKVIIRRNGQMVMSVQVPGAFTRLTGLPKNTYTAHVIAVNQMGAESPEAYLEFSIEAPPPPSHVDIEQGFFAITLIPRLAAITNVSTQFDFWTSGETQLPGTSTEIVEDNASREGMGTTWTSSQLQVGHTYYWYIRTINAFGASGFIEVPALCSMDTSSLIDLIDDSVQKSEAFQNIKEGVDTNLEGIMENALANHGTVQRQFEQYGEVKA
ncbi:phage tail tip protein J-related protein, partial [Citrobacter youngae]